MGVVVVVVSKLFIKRSHSNKYFIFHNNAYIIVQGGGGIKGVGSHSSYRISLYAVALACSWILLMLNAIGVNKCGGTVDTHSPILPVNLMKFSENIRLFPALTENIWIYLKLSGINWTHLKTSEIIWIHLKLSEYIWNYLNTSEFIWIYLKLFWWFSETIWNYPALSENIRHY